jgi:photosystem II stability/assembly factor-like uncharacterized protein
MILRALGLGLAIPLLCACGDGGSSRAPGPSPSPGATATPLPTATATPAPTAEPVGRWTTTGPEGGPVFTLALDPAEPEILYAGSSGGVFRSVDGGDTWSARSGGLRDGRGFLPWGGIVALAIDPGDPDVLYAGAVAGIWKSVDGGTSWAALEGDAGDAIAIDPAAPATVYATSTSGLRKSVDGGATWRELTLPVSGRVRGTLAAHPYRPGTVLAATGRGGVLVSHDGGDSWQGPSPSFPRRVHAFAFDPRDPDLVYAGAGEGGVFSSRDAGVTWRPWNEGLPRTTFASTSTFAADPDEAGTFYATAGPELYVRSDGDASWIRIGTGGFEVEAGALLVAPGGTLYAATVLGALRNEPEDRVWRPAGGGIRALPVLDLALDPANPDVVLAATDGGGVHRSADFGRTWSRWSGGDLADAMVAGVVVDPMDSSRVLASACGLLASDDAGRSWRQTLGFEGTDCVRRTYAARSEPARFAHHPSDPELVFAARGNFYRSSDRGRTWTYVLIPLNDEIQCHGLRAVAVDPIDPMIVYAVETRGGPVKSDDGGVSFPSVGCASIPFEGPAAIAIDPVDPLTVYASFFGGLVKSNDRGETWAPHDAPGRVWSLAFDPADPTTLYAGANDGVFVSRDGAATWQPVGDDLASAPVYALAIDPRDGRTLLAGTHGAGVQRLRLE